MNKKEQIWEPNRDRLVNSELFKFRKKLKEKNFLKGDDSFTNLWNWSKENPNIFWSEVWDFVKIKGKKGKIVLKKNKIFNKNVFFPDSKINFARNLLVKKNDNIAINFLSESLLKKKITWKNLYKHVCQFSSYLKKNGIKKGDVVSAYVPNCIETVVTFLGSAKNGSIWSSCSPDFGVNGVLERFSQIKPKVLITCDYYFYNGKKVNILEKIPDIISKIKSIKKVIIFSYENKLKSNINLDYTDFSKIIETEDVDEVFIDHEFNHPLYILYSSGTTGVPKCITHGAGNVLIEHKKEHLLHCDIKDGDGVFYYTTTGWMMWNWLISSLACGATLNLFDGSPVYPSINVLIKLCADNDISLFGVSAKYIDFLKKSNFSSNKINLKKLKTITSTGSPLIKESFDYVYHNIKKDVHLASISGGTDLVGCLVLGNLLSKVYPGEIQGASLGIDVDVFDPKGKSEVKNKKGELVVKKPFPTMPIKFWNDKNNKKYFNAYFNKFSNVWCHGDYVEKTFNDGYVIHGRSDATLNPGGVRIGTAEIYRQVEYFDEISESLVIGQAWKNDIRIVLFVVTKNNIPLNKNLTDLIKKRIKTNCSPKHVPSKIILIKEIPRTKSGKIVEIAVRKVIHGEKIENLEAIANPWTLDFFKNINELKS